MHTTTLAAPRPARLGRVALLALLACLVGVALVTAVNGLPSLRSALPHVWSGGGPLTEEDGLLPDGVGLPVDADVPAMTKLDEALRAAVLAATEDAAGEGQPLLVTSGWRSARYQERLFAEALTTYGSEDVARQFVAPAELSSHLTGDAVDVGPLDAQLWLMEHGYRYGLCQTYANERWHYELATTPGGRCPDMLPDASSLGS